MGELRQRYLMTHFTGESEEGEQVYMAVSPDGLYWQDINRGKPVLRSEIGEKGVRDPYLLRSKIDGRFYLLATDLRIAGGKGWPAAIREGSTKIIVWSTKDLIHWSAPWFYSVEVAGAGCAWAPEAVYDHEKAAYLVFWASWVKAPGDQEGRQRIFCSYTKDFIHFTKPQLYIERSHDVIDTTIIYENGVYYRFSKDETEKRICLDYASHLHGEFQRIHSEALFELTGVEGPAVYPLKQAGKWCLIVDRFAEDLGYLPLLCEQLEKGDFHPMDEGSYSLGKNKKRHGSVITITEEEYERLLKGE